jgi:hypothetical protein
MVDAKETGVEVMNENPNDEIRMTKMRTKSGCGMALLILWGAWMPLCGTDVTVKREMTVMIVVGAHGNEEYRKHFTEEAALLKEVCVKAGVASELIGSQAEDASKSDAAILQTSIAKVAENADAPLWLILIGHGSFDGRDAKFNLRGPDITAADVAAWLKPIKGEVAVIQTASSSAPFLKALAAPNRVLISATKSADEVFYARFGRYFAKAISGNTEADLDRDNQVSLLEAFLWSSKQVERFFETEGRLATEHALIEDSGDGIGTRAEAFSGVRLTTLPGDGKAGDGQLARQWCLVLNEDDAALTQERRKHRDDLERQVEALRGKRAQIPEAEFYQQLEKLMLEIAKISGEGT